MFYNAVFSAFLVLESSCIGRVSWMLNFNCLVVVLWLFETLRVVNTRWNHYMFPSIGASVYFQA